MGRSARSAGIIRIFVFALGLAASVPAYAAATAQGVALSASADCSRGDLDLTLSTAGAGTESWQATNAAGATLVLDKEPTGSLANFSSGTFTGFQIGKTGFNVAQPPNTLIGSYAWVGETPPFASNTAEFFVYYNCTTRQVLYSCFGAYGSCPQTAQAAAALTATAAVTTSSVPTLGPLALTLTTLVLGVAGGLALRWRI